MELFVDLKEHSYSVIISKGAIKKLKDYLDIKGKILIISDDLIPDQYINSVKEAFPQALIFKIKHGEENKNIITYQDILTFLSEHEFNRKDSIFALGGGLTSDIAGFVASSYMRGISFYIIPTTLLSQVDASIGGKVAINFNNYKNQVGAFYSPKKVIIDPDTLLTLDKRKLNEGLAEVIKMSMTSNKSLFEYIENSDAYSNLEYLISEALKIKIDIVIKDEKENGIRQILNFGHTVGHALEILSNGNLYHGEAVSIGMTYFVNEDIKDRLINVLKKYDLPYSSDVDKELIINKIKLDKKKTDDDNINIIYVNEIGKAEIRNISLKEIRKLLEESHEK